jgi:Uma2 family endonuclease
MTQPLATAPTETDLALANGNSPPLVRYDPAAPEPEFLFEVVDGFIVRKTVGASEVRLANTLNRFLAPFVDAGGLGQSFIELGYDLPGGGPRRKPDVSFVSEQRWPRSRPFPEGDFVPVAPEMAVEVVSPHELAYTVFSKIEQYFRAGVLAVWVVLPNVRQVYCYTSPTAVRILSRDNELTGDPIIPGFRLPLADLFPPPDEPAPAAP